MTSRLAPVALAFALFSHAANAQMGPGGPPPAVGVAKVRMEAVTESADFVGRIQAVERVDLTARVTAFLDQRLFVEGTEVKKGDLLYRLERPPFEAAVQQQAAAVAQANALLQNASLTLGRATSLLNTPAGQRSVVDDARAQQGNYAAQVAAAQAQLEIAKINLAYTEIHAPISGKISQTRVTPGNVVSASSGVLASIVSQDPMYVEFPVAVRSQIDLDKKYADRGGLSAAVVKIKLTDGSDYPEPGKIDFVAPSVTLNTDTIVLRATIANPPRRPPVEGQPVDRPLIDGMFVTVSVQGAEPVKMLAIPRVAILSNQQGNYVYVVNAQNVAEVRPVTLGQSSPTTAVIASGLKEGETVVVDGIQRVRPGQPVSPGPAGAAPGAPPGSPAASAPSASSPSAPAKPDSPAPAGGTGSGGGTSSGH